LKVESCVGIEIIKEVPFIESEDSLDSRLRNVELRGFPRVHIYAEADFKFNYLTSHEILTRLTIPQLRVYRPQLDRIDGLRRLFLKEEIDILNLNSAYDYVAFSESGEQTMWTMLPPVVERFDIPRNSNGTLNYDPLIGDALRSSLEERGLGINPEISNVILSTYSETVELVNDGTHRVYKCLEASGAKVLIISGMTPGFPYYAVPQEFDIKEFESREEALRLPETKIHIVESPAHKDLYRLFPSGGIMSGDVRPHKT